MKRGVREAIASGKDDRPTALNVLTVALLMTAASSAQAQTLEFATISKGGDVLPDGSVLIIGQPVADTMSNANFTVEVGIVPILASGGCVTTTDCDDQDDCTIDTCAPGSPDAEGDGCVHEYQVRLFADIVPSYCPPVCAQPDLDDIQCVLGDFGDGPSVDGCEGIEPPRSTDLAPCGGNGVLDLDDILTVLDAFAQIFPCPHPCP